MKRFWSNFDQIIRLAVFSSRSQDNLEKAMESLDAAGVNFELYDQVVIGQVCFSIVWFFIRITHFYKKHFDKKLTFNDKKIVLCISLCTFDNREPIQHPVFNS